MAEPITIAGVVIGGLVSAYKAYTEYKAATAKTTEQKAPPPAKSDAAAKGEQVAPIIKAGVEQHGNDDEKVDLANFERNPARYEDALARVLKDIATRSQPFAQQLQTLAQQAQIQAGGVQGSVNVSGQGRVYGTAVGVNTGTISGNYTIGSDEKTGESGQ